MLQRAAAAGRMATAGCAGAVELGASRVACMGGLPEADQAVERIGQWMQERIPPS